MANCSEKLCYFCNPGEEKSKFYLINGTGALSLECLCKDCGHYYIVEDAFDAMQKNDISLFQKLRAVAAMRKLQGRDGYTLSLNEKLNSLMIGDNDFLDEYPSDFREKIKKVLCNIGKLTNFEPGKKYDFNQDKIQYLFSSDKQAATNLLEFLKNENYIRYKEPVITQKCFSAEVSLTNKGFQTIQEESQSEIGFVAMWFDDSMKPYKEVIKASIRNAGYVPYIANEDLHNDQIMPKVLNAIKTSRFIIADLTCLEPTTDEKTGVRGGVYYEAGFAKGLGLPVILTCCKDAESRIHFDLKQNMCYLWKKQDEKLKIGDQDFAEVITQNILLNVGPGPRKNHRR